MAKKRFANAVNGSSEAAGVSSAAKDSVDLYRKIVGPVYTDMDRIMEALLALEPVRVVVKVPRRGRSQTEGGYRERVATSILAHSKEIASANPELVGQLNAFKRVLASLNSALFDFALQAGGGRIATVEARKSGGAPLFGEEDLAQEGYIGLLRAAKRFDPERGLAFSTYARWWVRAQMTRAVDDGGRTVRLPAGAREQLRNLHKYIKQCEAQGTVYNIELLAQNLGIEPRRVARLLVAADGVLNLDQPGGGDDGSTVGDLLSDPNAVSADDAAALNEALGRFWSAFDALSERIQYILTRRYGLNGVEAETGAEIGKKMRLSRERVRQLEKEGIARLREAVGLREDGSDPADALEL